MKKSNRARSTPVLVQSEPLAPRLDAPALSEGELGKIQEILLGKQIRSVNDQMESLHTYFVQQIENLSEEHRQEVAALRSQLKAAEADFDQRIRHQQKEHQTNLESNTSRLRAELSTTESSLVKQLGVVTDSLLNSREELVSQLNKNTQDLQSQKIDRDLLSGMFGKLANELSLSDGQAATEAGPAHKHTGNSPT